MTNKDYVLVSPVRNEERTIGITIESVLAQTLRPREWVIVSDESTDRTDEIIAHYARQHSWLRLLQLKNRPSRNFASVVFATEAGIKSLQTRDYTFLGLLDGDVRLPGHYYAGILDRFAHDSRLGLAGGLVLDTVEGKWKLTRQNLQDVAGAVQFFRRECFESLNGLMPLPEGGWDAITCARARMNGFGTMTFSDLVVEHLKPRNSAEGNAVRRKWQMGVRDYALGYHPLFEFIKCLSRVSERPFVVSSFAWFAGYLWSGWKKRQRMLPDETMHFIRREQLRRLKFLWRTPENVIQGNQRAASNDVAPIR